MADVALWGNCARILSSCDAVLFRRSTAGIHVASENFSNLKINIVYLKAEIRS